MFKRQILITILITCFWVLLIGLLIGSILGSIVCEWLLLGLAGLTAIVGIVMLYYEIWY